MSSGLGRAFRSGVREGRGAGGAEPEAGGSLAYLGSPMSAWLERSSGNVSANGKLVEYLGGAGLGWGRDGVQMKAEIHGRLCRGGGWWPWSGVAVHRPGMCLETEDLLTTFMRWEVGGGSSRKTAIRGTPVSGSWMSGRCIY